jgi:4-amino-4-deoxy-L-arabinose transferase-like glycosyltransferase
MPQPPTSFAPRQTVVGIRGVTLGWQAWMVLLLACHVLVWTWAGVAGSSNLDAPGDMVEAYAWGQSLEWGYFKHPPLSAWISGLWFHLLPEGQFGYALLAALNAAVGLAGTAVLARRLLPPDWALLVVAAAAMTPAVTSLAMRFNANAVLVSTWPWATAMFVAMMQDGRRRDALLCGFFAALAMLGKYYSGVMIVSWLGTALALPAWRRRLFTPLPWLAAATLTLCLWPHLNWLLAQTDGPIQYARSAAQESTAAATNRALHFGLVQALYPLLAFALISLSAMRGGRLRALRLAATALLRPQRQVAWLLAATPIVATMLATVVTGARTASVWGLPITASVAVLAASRVHAAGLRTDLHRSARCLGAAWLLVILVAPVQWLLAARADAESAGEPREELARAIDHDWLAEFGEPLPWVTGTRQLAASVSFYADSHPRYWSAWNAAHETPWVDPSRVYAEGGVIVCAIDDVECADIGAGWSQLRRDIEVAKSTRGLHFAARRYRVYLMPPRASSTMPDGD